MNESKHTSRPWVAEENSSNEWFVHGGDVLNLDHLFLRVSGNNAEQDARLLAAAPELLDELCRMVDMFSKSAYLGEDIEKRFIAARAAIAKARGFQ